MVIFKEKQAIEKHLRRLKATGRSIGFIPTMGAIHAGHLSLVKAAKLAGDLAVCSIFVNPTQFNDPKDFEKYPIRTEDDIRKLTEANTDILFLPAVDEIYPEGYDHLDTYDFGPLERALEGAFRPGHFQGVGQVMDRLLQIIRPDHLYMGQKDYQQTLIVNKLLELSHIKTKMVVCPILREKDGLAMSSRNVRLSPEAREKAAAMHTALLFVKNNLRQKPLAALIGEASRQLEAAGFTLDYFAVTDEHLFPLTTVKTGKAIGLAAAWIDGVRLIDNMALN